MRNFPGVPVILEIIDTHASIPLYFHSILTILPTLLNFLAIPLVFWNIEVTPHLLFSSYFILINEGA